MSALARDYVAGYLASATFQHFVTLFEQFVFDFIRVWLTEYPNSLAGKQLEFRNVVNAVDKDAIVRSVVDKEVLAVAYQKVADWFGYLEKIAKLGVPSSEVIERLAEIKASRDVLVHSNGIANKLYVQKAMSRARFGIGENLELPEHYHRESWELIKQVVNEIAGAGIAKLSR